LYNWISLRIASLFQQRWTVGHRLIYGWATTILQAAQFQGAQRTTQTTPWHASPPIGCGPVWVVRLLVALLTGLGSATNCTQPRQFYLSATVSFDSALVFSMTSLMLLISSLVFINLAWRCRYWCADAINVGTDVGNIIRNKIILYNTAAIT
jgi:hypothetical protein